MGRRGRDAGAGAPANRAADAAVIVGESAAAVYGDAGVVFRADEEGRRVEEL